MKLPAQIRPLNDKERRYLKNQRAALVRRQGSVGQGALGSVVIFGILAAVTVWAEGKHPRFIVGFWAVLGAAICIPTFIQERLKLSRRIERYDQAIADGTCADREIRAKRMWEFEEQEDEGACYAFELESGCVAFVVGQDFYASARFPNADFSLIQFHDKKGEVIDMLIAKRNAKIAAERVISAKEKEKLNIPEHAAFFAGTLEEVLEKLKRA